MPSLIYRLWDGKTMLVQNLRMKSSFQSLIISWQAIKHTFIKAHSFCAASLDMYIHDADFRFPM